VNATGPGGEPIRTVCAAIVTVHVKDTLAMATPSDTVAVTLYGLPTTAVEGMVPPIIPVVALRLRPGGKPVALKVRESLSGSLALSCSDTAWFPDVV